MRDEKKRSEIRKTLREWIYSYGNAIKFSQATGINVITARAWSTGKTTPNNHMAGKIEVLSKGVIKARDICLYENR